MNDNLEVVATVLGRIEVNNEVKAVIWCTLRVTRLESVDEVLHDA